MKFLILLVLCSCVNFKKNPDNFFKTVADELLFCEGVKINDFITSGVALPAGSDQLIIVARDGYENLCLHYTVPSKEIEGTLYFYKSSSTCNLTSMLSDAVVLNGVDDLKLNKDGDNLFFNLKIKDRNLDFKIELFNERESMAKIKNAQR